MNPHCWIAIVALSSAAVAVSPQVTLAPDGLAFGAATRATARFGQPRVEALRILAASLGKPLQQGTYPDCGQGIPMAYARYKGGLELVFLKGRFSGWSLDETGSRAWHTPRGIALGSSRTALNKAYPGVSVDDSSLGVLFTTGEDDVSGFLDSPRPTAKVVSMFAGETCMVS